jgi:hypothetical protein
MACLPFVVVSAVGTAFLSRTPTEPAHSTWVCVGQLAHLPDDGTPVRVAVQVPQRDAWTRLPDRKLGFVFLRRLPGGGVMALRAEHHQGFRIPVVYDPSQRSFRSTCWLVRFTLDGREIADDGALIGDTMQAVPVRVSDQAVFVRYEPPDGT